MLRTRKLRINLLLLVGFAYFAILTVFAVLVWKSGPNLDVAGAYQIVESPLMAVIGGSLAIAKDLIPDPDTNGPSPPTETAQ